MNQPESPLVTIGLPVFNGVAHLQISIDAILKQSYQNIELIICDNASTDGTTKIAEQASLRDKRVKYIRNDRNIGLFDNFNRVLQEASGEFFMWSAHDDLHSPNFIEECVIRLNTDPKAVLCQTRVAVCLEKSEQIIYYATLNSFANSWSIEKRYKETLNSFPAVAIYGVYRTKFAKSIPGFRKIPGGDLLWIQELALSGRFIQSEKVLFHYIARKKWNSFEDELKYLGPQSDCFKYKLVLASAALLDRIKSINRLESSLSSKTRLIVIAIQYSLKTICVRTLLRSLSLSRFKGVTIVMKKKLYWRYLHNPNIEIVNEDLFLKRVINPTIGLL
jgi:glycosyltransferase involved in cell wall biosynthesis